MYWPVTFLGQDNIHVNLLMWMLVIVLFAIKNELTFAEPLQDCLWSRSPAQRQTGARRDQKRSPAVREGTHTKLTEANVRKKTEQTWSHLKKTLLRGQDLYKNKPQKPLWETLRVFFNKYAPIFPLKADIFVT